MPTQSVRAPAVAGLFYPADAPQLRATIGRLLAAAPATAIVPKAIIVPHAGYPYSGPVAACAYAALAPLRERILRVVLLGPSHRVPLVGLAASSARAFASPLGEVELDRPAIERLRDLPQMQTLDPAHALEHSLEVHLPFLQEVLADFRLVPLVVGEAGADEVAEVLERLWGGPETLIVLSTDLSHYHDYAAARRLDAATCAAIETLHPERIAAEQACGRYPLAGLLALARRRGLQVRTVDLRNSGDTAGSRDTVVGYGAWLIY